MRNAIKLFALAFALIAMVSGASAAASQQFTVYWTVASSYDITISYNANCSGGSIYFVENDALIDGNMWKVLPYGENAGSNICQDDSGALFTIALTGTASADYDINISVGGGHDVNAKVSLADDTAYCGAASLGGWEEDCTTAAGADGNVSTTTCKQIGSTNTEFYQNAASGSTLGFCINADFNACADGTCTPVAAGDNEETIGVTSGAVD